MTATKMTNLDNIILLPLLLWSSLSNPLEPLGSLKVGAYDLIRPTVIDIGLLLK